MVLPFVGGNASTSLDKNPQKISKNQSAALANQQRIKLLGEVVDCIVRVLHDAMHEPSTESRAEILAEVFGGKETIISASLKTSQLIEKIKLLSSGDASDQPMVAKLNAIDEAILYDYYSRRNAASAGVEPLVADAVSELSEQGVSNPEPGGGISDELASSADCGASGRL